MDIKKIKAIIELVKDSGIAEIEITEGEEKLKISTSSPHSVTQHHVMAHSMPYSSMPHSSMGSPMMNHQMEARHDNSHESTNAHINVNNAAQGAKVNITPENHIVSPMVGTFYRSSSPTSAPFVEIGQEIKIGQVICIIEAMKLMNQIEADRGGVIKDILVKDGAPVEFGQPLFIIE
jgi:acetyl-CoA carboxylase biotin carboxyl carrier protein